MSKLTILTALLLLAVIAVPLSAQVKEEEPGMLAQARVKADSAQRTALRRVPGGRIESAELEREHGTLIYSFDIKVDGKEGIEEVHVDANTGAVVKMEHENGEDEAREAAEAHPEGGMKEESPGLLRQAAITPDSARNVAMRRVPNGKVKESEIEQEDGKLVYVFLIKVEGKAGVEEVLVDAKTGAVVGVEHEND
ncbi:MAG: PepSY domain-containing protein [Gemmatimonadota bacterium]